METVKQRTERIMSMTHGQLVMHCQDLTAERDKLKAALLIAQQFCGSLTSDVCPDTVAIPINEALKESA